MKRIFSFCLVFIMLASFVSCGENENKLIGTWEYEGGLNCDSKKITFYEDGSCMVNNEKGYWYTYDERLSVLGPYGGRFWNSDSIVGEYDVDGDTLTFQVISMDTKNRTGELTYKRPASGGYKGDVNYSMNKLENRVERLSKKGKIKYQFLDDGDVRDIIEWIAGRNSDMSFNEKILYVEDIDENMDAYIIEFENESDYTYFVEELKEFGDSSFDSLTTYHSDNIVVFGDDELVEWFMN